MADFEAEINEKIIVLAEGTAQERREAAYFLGEVGADIAIPRLADVYREDEDRSVRDAAAYALGMFKAIDEALKSGKEEKVLELLRQVSEEGKLGSRSRGTGLLKLDIVLLLLAVALFALGVILPGVLNTGGASTPEPTAVVSVPAKDRGALLSEVNFYYTQINSDATKLQEQFTSMLGGTSPDCSAFYNNPVEYTLDPGDAAANPDIARIVDELNAVRQTLNTVKLPRDQACPPYGTPIPDTDIGGLFGKLNQQVVAALPPIQTEIGAAMIVPTGTALPTITAVPTEGPTPTTGPTVAVADVSSHLPRLYSKLETLQHDPGVTTLLVHYWSDAANPATQSSACLETPQIPELYVLPDIDAQASPQLKQVVDGINTGIGLLHQGWDLLKQTCDQRNWSQTSRAGQNLAQTAAQYFMAARSLLDTLRTGG